MAPFAPTFSHKHCRICKHIRQKKYNQTPGRKYIKMKSELRAAIRSKKERIQRLEQEISGGNGEVQNYQDQSNTDKIEALIGRR